MARLPEDALERVRTARRKAESDLEKRLSVIKDTEDIELYLQGFTFFATALFDAEAEEFVSVCDNFDTLEEILRDEVTSRIIESILPDQGLQTVLQRKPESALPRALVQVVDSQIISEVEPGEEAKRGEEPTGELTPAREHVQGIHALHGYWERFTPPHIGFIRSRDNSRVRRELGQVLQRRAFYWLGQSTLQIHRATGFDKGISDPKESSALAGLGPPPALPTSTVQHTRRGPKPNYAAAMRVAQVVRTIEGDENWLAKLDPICDALDEHKIPCPKTWIKRGYKVWYDALLGERSLVVKAITHHLRLNERNQKTLG